jgi:hypothetical protein
VKRAEKWVPLELPAGQAGRLQELLGPTLGERRLAVISELRRGFVRVEVRSFRDGDVVVARETYERPEVETLGELWAERAAADLREQLGAD